MIVKKKNIDNVIKYCLKKKKGGGVVGSSDLSAYRMSVFGHTQRGI